jgi:poly(3-hydroxybutyrate) depolymerase
MEKIAREADAERLAVLSDSQRSAFAKLKGKEFRLARSRGFRGLFAATPSHGRIQRRTYRFDAAGKEMEYALYVPTGYDAKKPTPLIVALHGLGSNPQQVIRYGQLTELAEKHGTIVVAPMGYNERGWYGAQGELSRFAEPQNLGELSEQDVMNVFERTRKEFAIDESRMYLMGHSMGGGGTWHLAMQHPGLWAAIAPIAPAPTHEGLAGLEKIKHIPAIVVQGDEDSLVPVANTRRWVAKMKDLGMDYTYIEVPGGGHVDVALDNIPQVIEFFEKHRKPAKAE